MLPTKKNEWLPGIFNDLLGNEWLARQNPTTPAVNIKESDKQYTVELAAPGLSREDFNIDIDENNHLVISMEKKSENRQEDGDSRYLRREFSFSSFRQSLILPDHVNEDKIEASVNDGVLTVNIPKKSEAEKQSKRKSIEIK